MEYYQLKQANTHCKKPLFTVLWSSYLGAIAKSVESIVFILESDS